LNNTFFKYRERHNGWVNHIAQILKGTVFETAPFDIIDVNKRCIEVKVNESKDRKHRYRIQLSKDEVNFGRLMPLWVFLICPEKEAYLIPFDRLKVGAIKSHLVSNFTQKHYEIWIDKTLRECFKFDLSAETIQKYIEAQSKK
jgi:CRISPR/Cas system-associated exonuclease Cas4 (RecB family)